jgi:putative ABC transport system substrate-binding protein
MRRRTFITLLGGAAVWPLAAHAQQRAAATVGFLHSLSPEATVNVMTAFRSGLAETGHVEGRNVSIEYRWARGNFDLLPIYAADLARMRVAVTVATGSMFPR